MESTAADVRALNERLGDGLMFFEGSSDDNSSEGLFENLRKLGFDQRELIVLSLTPDGDGTVIGRFLTVQHHVYRFDIDLYDHRYSTVEKVEPQEPMGDPRSLLTLEYAEEVVGRALLEERRGASFQR